MSLILDELYEVLARRTARHDPANFTIKATYETRMVFRPNRYESPHVERFLVVASRGTGLASLDEPDHALDLAGAVGLDCRNDLGSGVAVAVAAMDSAFSQLPKRPQLRAELGGTLDEKARARAGLVRSEVMELVRSRSATIHCVGAVGTLIKALVDTGFEVTATDLSPEVVGTTLGGVKVQDGRDANDWLIPKSDVVLVTGMSLVNGTFATIARICTRSDCRMVVYAQSAANIFPHINSPSLRSIISEPYPTYLLPGVAKVKIYRLNERTTQTR